MTQVFKDFSGIPYWLVLMCYFNMSYGLQPGIHVQVSLISSECMDLAIMLHIPNTYQFTP